MIRRSILMHIKVEGTKICAYVAGISQTGVRMYFLLTTKNAHCVSI